MFSRKQNFTLFYCELVVFVICIGVGGLNESSIVGNVNVFLLRDS
jgi:hypothetical protein